MGALNPVALWGGLALLGVAIPILIHLLYRKHRRQTDWAAMELLRRALVMRSGQVRLEDYLVLALRCLALLLLALALLRPTLSSDANQWLGQKRAGLVIGIDASFSMNHGEHSRFERALDLARTIAATAREGDPVTIVLMSSRPEVLLRGASYVPSQVEEALETRSQAQPYPLNLDRNLHLLGELVDELKTPATECYLVTDAQAGDWSELPPAVQDSLAGLGKKARVFVVPTGSEPEDNLAIEDLSFASGALRPSQVGTFSATVRNAGGHPVDEKTIEFLVNDQLRSRQGIGTLAPGEARDLFFNTSFESAGPVRVTARLGRDALPDDNQRHTAVQVRESVNVLAVAGGRPDPASSDLPATYHAATALRPREFGIQGEIRVNQVTALDLPLEDLGSYEVVILADVPAPGPDLARRLRDFVERGGGLIVFAGNQVEPDLYNDRLGTGPDGLLPATIGEVISREEEDEGWPLAPVRSDHLLAGMVRRLPPLMIDEPRFAKVMRATPVPGSETVLTIPQLDAPLLLARRVGQGTSLLFTSSADLSWNNFANQSLFVALLHQAVNDLTSNPDALQVTCGETVSIPLRHRGTGEFVTLTNPDATTEDLRVAQTGEAPVVSVDFPVAGFYALASQQGDRHPPLLLAANVDRRESDVRLLPSSILAEQLSELGTTVISDAPTLADTIRESRRGRELAHLLLALAIIVFVLQSLLARHFTNRMARGDAPDLSATLQMSRVAAARRS